MTVVVTGANGFLGRALCRALLAHRAHDVVRVGRTARDGITACDLLDPEAVARLVQTHRPACVFHLAATFENGFEAGLHSNVFATHHLLQALHRHAPLARVVLAGSAAEYGWVEADDNPVPETHVLRPISMYGWSKAAQTQLGMVYHRAHGLDVMTARLFNLLGPGAPERLFVGRVARQIEEFRAGRANRISVGRLDACRDYLHVDLAARALLTVSERGQSGEVYNVAAGVPTRMHDLLRSMLHTAGIDMAVVDEMTFAKPGSPPEVPVIYADVRKLRGLEHRAA